MSRIFISYRRDDSAGHAGRLYDRLSEHFGQDQIFMDISTIEPGVDFVEVIEEAVSSCGVLIALIGKQWLTITDANRRRRLDNPKDLVHLEIATALDRNIRVIPVLVGGATMPRSTDLPNALRKLARLNALEISDTRFDYDVNRLIGTLQKVLGVPESAPPKPKKKRPITISPLKQESAAPTRLPFEPEMARIPTGKFLMGTREEDLDALARKYGVDRKAIAREIPWHKVPVREFEIGRYPVTNFQYRAFVQDTGREPPPHWEGDQYPEELDNHPVVNVSWHDAVAYCKWLSEKTGKPYRLPAEAEWEKAARGTDRREFPWGDGWDVSKCNTREGGPGTTTPVGQYSPHGDSFYGVADMAGNVWEWCADWLGVYKGNPFPDEDYGETHRVLRGSSWDTYGLAHCAFRYARRSEDISNDIGFRCAKDIVDRIKHKLGTQHSPEVAQILRRYEGKRIKANREDKPDQYFVYRGMLHYLEEDAAQICNEPIGPFEDLDRNEEFILDIKEVKGSPYNCSKMIEVLKRIKAEEIERSGE